MVSIINPIHGQALHEGQVAEVLHAIAHEMMVRRSYLLRNTMKVSKGESRVYRKQSQLLEEYATALDAIYYQLEPAQWDPERFENLLRFAQAHNIVLPDWMFADQANPLKLRNDKFIKETTEDSINRFDNEGGRIWETG